jgi:hypothetical protein
MKRKTLRTKIQIGDRRIMNVQMNRREAIAVASAVTLAGAGQIQASDEPAADPSRFGKPCPVTSIGLAADAITHSADISPDGRAITILFDKSMQFNIDDSSLTKTWAAAIQIPQTLQKMPPTIVFMAFVQGFVAKDPATRIVVSLDMGGVNRVVEFPFGDKAGHESDWDAMVLSSLPTVVEHGTTPAGGETSTTKILDLGFYPVAIAVTIQRATPKDQAILSVSSIDIETLTPIFDKASRRKARR